jgi:PAS domain-containing protein
VISPEPTRIRTAKANGGFGFLADKAPVLIWMSDSTMAFDYLNKSWLDFTGNTLDQELGDKWLQAITKRMANCWETYSNSFQEHKAFTMDIGCGATTALPLGPQHRRAALHADRLLLRLYRLVR